jgi:altronate dehydratase
MKLVRLNSADNNVAIALEDLPANGEADGVAVREAVARGHKLAVTRIGEGEAIFKFGQVIGVASEPIVAGAHVHAHNVSATAAGAGTGPQPAPAAVSRPARAEFAGFRRAGGACGTRNYLGVVATVNCSATIVR